MKRNMAVIGRCMAVVFAAISIVLLPLLCGAQARSFADDSAIKGAVDTFINRTYAAGKLTLEDYRQLQRTLGQLDGAYDIELIVSRTKESMDEEMTVGSAQQDFWLANVSSRAGSYEEKSGLLRLAATGSSSGHIHTDDCFCGHSHEASGCFVHTCSSNCYSEYYDPNATSYHGLMEVGMDSGTPFECNACKSTCIRYVTYHECPECGYTTTGTATSCGNIHRPVAHPAKGAYISSKTCGYSKSGALYKGGTKQLCTETEDLIPVCSQVIIGLLPSFSSQIIYGSEELDCTAAAIYLDGHTGLVVCTPRDYDNTKYGMLQNVTLELPGYFESAKNYTVITAQIAVTVLPQSKLCEKCKSEYSLSDDGSDPGCPYCANKPLGIRAELLKTQYDIGQELEANVYVIYENGETLLDYELWTDDFDSSMAGEQLVTFSYENMITFKTAWVTGSNQQQACETCENEYDETEYDDCPYCAVLLTGITMRLEANLVMYGSPLEAEVYAVFASGDTELLTGGYVINGYDPYKIGAQLVTAEYEGFSAQAEVTVLQKNPEGDYVTCENGHTYWLSNPEAESACPYCEYSQSLEEKPEHTENLYTDGIEQLLESEGSIKLLKGDMLSVTIVKTEVTLADFLSGTIMRSWAENRKYTSGIYIR